LQKATKAPERLLHQAKNGGLGEDFVSDYTKKQAGNNQE